MPRKPGDRIEAPDTLGRKCWAFAYLRQVWEPQALSSALSSVGLHMDTFIEQYNEAVPFTMNLCFEVMANCFVNASYAPALRNGTCPWDIDKFHYLGFDRENLKRKNIVKYPF